MLEFYGDQDGARELLTNYAYDEKFPSNPNAHVYLYEFLKREKAPRAKLISVLKVETFPRVWFYSHEMGSDEAERLASHLVYGLAWAGLELLVLQSLPPEFWDNRPGPLDLA